MWLTSRRPPLSYYGTDHSELSQALSFYQNRFIALVLYGLRLFFSHLIYFVFPKSVCILLKTFMICVPFEVILCFYYWSFRRK